LIILDDEVEIVNALCELLREEGFETTGFSSAPDALAALRALDYDILLTDLMMPEMDGIAVVTAALVIDPNLICVVMTGQGTVRAAVEAMKLGAYDFLLKPCSLSELLPMLARCLDKRRLQLENLQLRESMAIYELSQATSGVLDSAAILERLADAVCRQSAMEDIVIFLADDNHSELQVAISRGKLKLCGKMPATPLSREVEQWVFRQYEALAAGVTTTSAPLNIGGMNEEGTAVAFVPMLAGQRLVGILGLALPSPGRALTGGQLKGLSVLSHTAAAALENTRLYRKVSESEARYRALAEGSPDAIFIVDREGTFQYVNQGAAQAMGHYPSEMIGKRTSDFFPPEFNTTTLRNFEQVLATGKPLYLENRVQLGERSTWQSTWLMPLPDEDGCIRFAMGVSRDLTAQKDAEAALRSSEERFRQMAETIGEVFWMTDPATSQMLYISPAFETVWGRSCQSLYDAPQSFMEAIHPEDRSRVIATMGDKLRIGQFDMEYRVIQPDGSARWVWDQAFPVRDEAGSVYRVVGIAQDITERKASESELRNERNFVSAVLDTVGSMLMVMDFAGRIVRTNRAFETLFGYSADEVLGRNAVDLLIAPEEVAMAREVAASLRAGNFPIALRYTMLTKKGTRLLIAYTSTCLTGRDGQVEFVIGSGTDITESTRMEKALRTSRDELESRVTERTAELATTNGLLQSEIGERRLALNALRSALTEVEAAKAEAERANRAKSEFLSNMSHELRTPLNAILGFGQILESSAADPTTVECVGHILKGGRHLLGLINEILDIAKVEAGQLELSLEPVSLHDLVLETISMVRLLAQRRCIQLDFNAADIAGLKVAADRQRLKQVLLNLLSNAIKYNLEEGTVEVSCQDDPAGRIALSVRDTGPGISPENLLKLFTPFERLGAANTEIEGTGLGLVLSRRLMEAMDGTIKVESELGLGTIFTLILPKDSQLESISPEESGKFDQAEPSMVLDKCTVLCIEDNPSNLRLIEAIFKRRPQVNLVIATQGAIGIDLARELSPDIILLDLNLPDLHGREVLDRLLVSSTTRDIPVVILSADATAERTKT